MRPRRFTAAAAALAALMAGSAASAQTLVADFRDDFQGPTPAAGWSYQWNEFGPVGTAANYDNLVHDSTTGFYDAGGDSGDGGVNGHPEPAPGAFAIVGPGFIHPGQGTSQNAVERYTIANYTISAQDIADAGGGPQLLTLDDYEFSLGEQSDGVNAKVYKNDTLLIDRFLPPGTAFTSDLPDPDGGPIALGEFAAGDVLRVAIGAGSADAFDTLTVDYSIILTPVPEPASLALLGLGGLGLLSRRRK